MKKIWCLLCLIFLSFNLNAQREFKIKGSVRSAETGEYIGYSTVSIWNSKQGAMSDSVGNFEIPNVLPGSYRLQISLLGYKTFVSPEFEITNKDYSLDCMLESTTQNLEEVSIVASPFRHISESPLGLKVVGWKEIEKSPGGNRDISKIVQSFPGVASTAAYRNDLIIRGGGPAENKFYLDGIEIPTINHFATQGASGGPVGIINSDFIREVNFYSSAYPVLKTDGLSSLLDFKLRDGNREKHTFRGVVGASEIGFSSNGPISKNTTYLVSIRQSYLQFLFNILDLPFLPTFTDAQFKIKHNFNNKNELSFIGLGGIDNMKLNTNIKNMSDENLYILSYLPVIKQNTYTVGAVYKHYSSNGNHTFVLSHSYLDNKNTKYKDNNEADENLILKYKSKDISTKFRTEHNLHISKFQINFGVSAEYNQFSTHSFKKQYTNGANLLNYDTSLDFFQWGVGGNIIYESSNNKFSASLGVRTDAATYSSDMNNPLKQLSPRLALSYSLTEKLTLNGSVGRYYQLPPSPTMAYKSDNEFINRTNGLSYIRSDQASVGIDFKASPYLLFTIEGFYKAYSHYPMSVKDTISMSSKGVDYGVLGDEEVKSISKGHTYGFEIMSRWYNFNNLTFIGSYTFVRSLFRDERNKTKYIPSAWDNKHLFSFSGTYSLPKKWDFGLKLRLAGGTPYTPYDLDKSSMVEAVDSYGGLIYDYAHFNSKRLEFFSQLDLRVDKTFYFKKVMLDLYIDLQNVLNSKYKQPDVYIKTGNIVNPDDPIDQQRYEMKRVASSTGTIVPTVGIIVEI